MSKIDSEMVGGDMGGIGENMESSQEKEVKKLKRALESWRELILPLNSVLIWNKPWYLGLIVGIITTIFLLLWWMDLSVLTTVCILGLIVTLADHLIPTITATWFSPEAWTGNKEREFEEVCRGIARTHHHLLSVQKFVEDLRVNRPRLHFSTIVSVLLVAAWIGNCVNNLLLTYFTVVLIGLLPGLKHHGILQKYFSQAMITVANSIKTARGKQE